MKKPVDHSEKNQSQGVLEAVQDALIKRFTRNAKQPEPVVFEFTNDKGLLHQYYRLRDQMFGGGRSFNENESQQDIHDKISEILVARRGRLVIGACRLTVREGDETFMLPMEEDHFKLRELFPDLPLAKERHGVISKFAILEEHNARDILYGLCKIMYDKVIMSDIHYLFARGRNYVLARNWRLIANSFGATHTRICEEINMPDDPNFPGEKPYLTFSNLADLCLKEFPRVPVPTERKLKLIEQE